MTAHSYGELVWNYLVLNRKPHTKWEARVVVATAAVTE
jgi:hypothetical protein